MPPSRNSNKPVKARSCVPCRTSKVRCDRGTPCTRCLRLRIHCHDGVGTSREHPSETLISVSHMLPTLVSAVAFDLCLARYGPKQTATDKALIVLRIFSALYRNKGHPQLLDFISSLAEGLGQDLQTWLQQPTAAGLAMDWQRVSQSYPTVHLLHEVEVRVEQVAHPYTLELFQDPFLSLAFVVCMGEERIFCNQGWTDIFHTEPEARTKALMEGLRPTEILGTIVHPEDRAYIVPMLDNCLFGSPDSLCESAHVLKCQSPRSSIGFLALVRIRTVVTPEGYMSVVFSLQPLPMSVDMVNVALPFQGVVASRNAWQEYLVRQEQEKGLGDDDGDEEEDDNASTVSSITTAGGGGGGGGGGASTVTSGGGGGGGGGGSSNSRRRSTRRPVAGGTMKVDEVEEEEEGFDDDTLGGRESFYGRASDAMSDLDDGGRYSMVTAMTSASAIAEDQYMFDDARQSFRESSFAEPVGHYQQGYVQQQAYTQTHTQQMMPMQPQQQQMQMQMQPMPQQMQQVQYHGGGGGYVVVVGGGGMGVMGGGGGGGPLQPLQPQQQQFEQQQYESVMPPLPPAPAPQATTTTGRRASGGGAGNKLSNFFFNTFKKE